MYGCVKVEKTAQARVPVLLDPLDNLVSCRLVRICVAAVNLETLQQRGQFANRFDHGIG
jgi:hypothetical protein